MIEPQTAQPEGGWDCHVHVFSAAAPARTGHYRPVNRPLSEIESTAQAHGVDHLVIVQPSVYGVDNTLLLQSLAVNPGRHRGVVVLNDTATDAELDEMHALGVRGVRFNLVSPVGEGATPSQQFAALAPRLRERGWHVQWYVDVDQLPTVAALHRGSGLTCVLDHLAGLHAGVQKGAATWRTIEDLAQQATWIKFSGWYRLKAQEPYRELLAHVQRLSSLFGDRMVWGSDWPHTMFPVDELPSYESTWRPVQEALGLAPARALRSRHPAIYF